jgi:type II secretory pathway component PulF
MPNSSKQTRNTVISLIGRHLQSGKDFKQTLAQLSRYPVKRTAGEIEKIRRSFEETNSLEETLIRHPDVFPEELLLVAQHVKNTELLGDALADYHSHQGKIDKIFSSVRRTAIANRIYLLFLLGLTAFFTVMMHLFVIPQFTDLYGHSGVALPAFTQTYLSVVNFIGTWWYLLLLLLAAGYIYLSIHVLSALKSVRTDKLRSAMTRLPFFGKPLRYLVIAKGVALVNLLLNTGANPAHAMKIGESYAEEKGVKLSPWLERILGVKYEHLLEYYKEGEILENEAAYIAEETYEHITLKMLNRSRIYGLVSFTLVASIVGSTVVAIYLPILSMTQVF